MVDLPFIKKSGSKDPAPPSEECKKCEEVKWDQERCMRRAAVLNLIIDRYREQIEMGETKTVSDLKNLVDPLNPSVAKLKESLISEFRPYIYEKNFLEAAQKAFEFVRDEIGNEVLPVDFWLLPEDMLELKVADEMDKAILLCSLLISLNNESARVVVETEGHRHAFVLFEFAGKFHLMDPVHDVNSSGPRDEVLKQHLQGHESKLIYDFNNKGYNEW